MKLLFPCLSMRSVSVLLKSQFYFVCLCYVILFVLIRAWWDHRWSLYLDSTPGLFHRWSERKSKLEHGGREVCGKLNIKSLFTLSQFMSDIRRLVPTKAVSKSLDLTMHSLVLGINLLISGIIRNGINKPLNNHANRGRSTDRHSENWDKWCGMTHGIHACTLFYT